MSNRYRKNKNPSLLWKNSKGKEFSYNISDIDRDKLLKACAYEGKPQTAVCWSLLQRFAFIYPKFKTLDAFISSYVQPINPAWFITGKKHISYIERLNKQYTGDELKFRIADANRRAVNRKKYASSEITNNKYIEIMESIFNLTVASPGYNIIHYCASFASILDSESAAKQKAIDFGLKKQMIMVDFGQSFLPGTNWFYTTNKALNFKLRLL
jgi:hypothetical protein